MVNWGYALYGVVESLGSKHNKLMWEIVNALIYCVSITVYEFK
jgi:hypothetical protein